MKELQYFTTGTCSKMIYVRIDENHIIEEVSFIGGCNGNLQGISRLVKGRKVQDVIADIEGISCGGRPTSCPDQLAKALRKLINQS